MHTVTRVQETLSQETWLHLDNKSWLEVLHLLGWCDAGCQLMPLFRSQPVLCCCDNVDMLYISHARRGLHMGHGQVAIAFSVVHISATRHSMNHSAADLVLKTCLWYTTTTATSWSPKSQHAVMGLGVALDTIGLVTQAILRDHRCAREPGSRLLPGLHPHTACLPADGIDIDFLASITCRSVMRMTEH